MDVDISNSFQLLNASFVGFRKKEADAPAPQTDELFSYAGSRQSCLTCFILLRPEASALSAEMLDGPLGSGNASSSFSVPTVPRPTIGHKPPTNKVKMIWSHPLPPSLVMVEYPNLAKFALAYSGTSSSAEQLTYTFVLTDGKGVRKYGHCTTFVNGDAVVSISPFPWCNFFYRLAYLYRTNGPDGGQRIVRALCNCPTPPSGASFLTPSDLSVKFTRPYDRLCSFIDTSPVDMLAVFPDNDVFFSVLADLLLEKHVIIVGPNFPLVSSVIMSLQAYLAPFDWAHILIPILPSDLIDVLAAPPPYLVGILTSQLPLVDGVPLDSVVMVHLGVDGVCSHVVYHEEERDYLPHSGHFSALRVGLGILRTRVPRHQTVRDLCSLSLTYYASLFGDVVLRGAKGYIKTANMSKGTLAFFEKLLATQSFTILSEEVNKVINSESISWMDNEFIVAIIRAHPDVYPTHYEQLITEEKSGGGYVEKYEDCFGSKENFNSITAAIHGFGGHKMGIASLLTSCLCGHFCGSGDHGGDDDYDEASYNFFRGSLADKSTNASRRASGAYPSTMSLRVEETPVIENVGAAPAVELRTMVISIGGTDGREISTVELLLPDTEIVIDPGQHCPESSRTTSAVSSPTRERSDYHHPTREDLES